MLFLWMVLRFAILALLLYGITSGKIANVYFWFMWIAGERDKDNNPYTTQDREYITYKLRRQVQRLKERWWVLSLGTIVGLTIALTLFISGGYWSFPWFDLCFYSWATGLWLFPHIFAVVEFPPERKRK